MSCSLCANQFPVDGVWTPVNHVVVNAVPEEAVEEPPSSLA